MYIGIFTPDSSGKNLSRLILELASYPMEVSCGLSATRLPSDPKLGVLMLPARDTVAKSASLVLIRPTAAQPPSLLKSVRRSSFTQISALSENPSSGDQILP